MSATTGHTQSILVILLLPMPLLLECCRRPAQPPRSLSRSSVLLYCKAANSRGGGMAFVWGGIPDFSKKKSATVAAKIGSFPHVTNDGKNSSHYQQEKKREDERV